MSWMNASFDESSNDIGAALDELSTLEGTMPSQHLNLLNLPPLVKESISNNIPYNSTTSASAAASLANPVRNGSSQVGHHLPFLLDRLEPPLKGGASTVLLDGGLPLPPEDQLVVACPVLDLDNMTANELCEDISYTQQTLGLMAGTKERKSNGVDEPPQLVSPPAGPTHTPPQARTPSPTSTRYDSADGATSCLPSSVMLLSSTVSSHHPNLQYQPFSRSPDTPVTNIGRNYYNYNVATHSNNQNHNSHASSSTGMLPFSDSFLVPSPASATGMTPLRVQHSSFVDSVPILPSPTVANNVSIHSQSFQSPQALTVAASSSQHNSSLSLRLSLSPSQCTQPSQSGTTANETNRSTSTNMSSQLECAQIQSHAALLSLRPTIPPSQTHKQHHQLIATSTEQVNANLYPLVASECPPCQVNVSHSNAKIGSINQTATNGTTHATAGADAASTSGGNAGVTTAVGDCSVRVVSQQGEEGGSGGEGGPGKQSNKRSLPKDGEEESTSHETSTSSDSSQDSNTPSKKAKRPTAALPVMSTSTTTAWTAATLPRAILTASAARADPPVTLSSLGGAQHTASGAAERHESSSSWGNVGRLPRVSSQTDLFEGSEDFFAAPADEEETDKRADQTPHGEQDHSVVDLLSESVTGSRISPCGRASSTPLLQPSLATTGKASTAPSTSSVGQLTTPANHPPKMTFGSSSPSSSSHGPSSSDTSSDEKVVVEYSKLKKNRDYEISPTLERRRRELSEAALPASSSSLHPRRIHFNSDQSSSSDDRLGRLTEGPCKPPSAAVDTEEEGIDDDDVTVLNSFEQSLEVVYDAKTAAADATASKIGPIIDLDISENVGSQDISLFLQADTQSFESQCIPSLEPSVPPHDKSDLKTISTTSKPINGPPKEVELSGSGDVSTKGSSASDDEKRLQGSDDVLPSMSSSESFLCHDTLSSSSASDACVVERESQQQQIPCTINPTQLQSLLSEAEHPVHSQSPDISPLLDEPLKQASVTGKVAKQIMTSEGFIASQRDGSKDIGLSDNRVSESDEGLSNGTSVRFDVASESKVSSAKKRAVESSTQDSQSEVFIIEERTETPPPPPPELAEHHSKLKLKSPTKYKDICHQSLIPSSNPISQSNSSSDSSSNGNRTSGSSDVIPLPGFHRPSQSSRGKKSAEGVKEKSSSSSPSEIVSPSLKITMPDINLSQSQLSPPFPPNSGSIVAKASKVAQDNILEAERKREKERTAETHKKQRTLSSSDSFSSLSLDTAAVIRPERTPTALPALHEAASPRLEVSAAPETTAISVEVSSPSPKTTAPSVEVSSATPKITKSSVDVSSATPKNTAPRAEVFAAPKTIAPTVKVSPTTPNITAPRVKISSVTPKTTASSVKVSSATPKSTAPRAEVSAARETAVGRAKALSAAPGCFVTTDASSSMKSPGGDADNISELSKSNLTSPRMNEEDKPSDSSSSNIETVSDRDARRTSTPNLGHLPQGVSPNISGEGGSYIEKEIGTPNVTKHRSTTGPTTDIPQEGFVDGGVERSDSNKTTVELNPADIAEVDSLLNVGPLLKSGDVSLEEFVPQGKFKTEVTIMKRSKDGHEIYSLKLGDKQIFLEDIFAKTKVFRTGSGGSTSSSDRRVSDVSTITSSSGYQADKSSSSSSCSRRMSTLSQAESVVSAPPPRNAAKTSRFSIESVQILSGPVRASSSKEELDEAGSRVFALPSSTRPLKTRSPRVPPMVTIEEYSSSDDKDSATMTPTSRSYSSFKASRGNRTPRTKVRSLIAEETAMCIDVSEDSPRTQPANTEVVDLTASESSSVKLEPVIKLHTPEVKASPRAGITNKGLHYDRDKFFDDLPPSILNILRSVQMSEDEEDIFLKSDTCSTSALDVHEEQARMVISRMISVKIVPNILVFAKYQDHYYSAVIESENPSGGWNIRYTLDGFQKHCPIEHILPIDILPRGQHCFRRYQGSSDRTSIVSVRVVIQGHSVENGAVLHIAADTQQVFKVPHSHLSMQLNDAERFVNAWKVTQSIVSGGPEVSMQNIIYGKRRRAPASPSTLTPEAGPQLHQTPHKPRSAPVRKKKLSKPDPNLDTSLTETDFHAGEAGDRLGSDTESSDSCRRPRKKQAFSSLAGGARSSAGSCWSSDVESDTVPVIEELSSPPKHPRLTELMDEAITDDDPSDDESYSPKSSSSKKRTPRKSTPRLTRKKKSSSPCVVRLARGAADDDNVLTPAKGASERSDTGLPTSYLAPDATSTQAPEEETAVSSKPSRFSKESKVSKGGAIKTVAFDLDAVSAETAVGEETVTVQEESSSKKRGRKSKVKASKTSVESPVQVDTEPVATSLGAHSSTTSITTLRKRGRPPGSFKESSDGKSSKVAKLELNRVDESDEADTSLQEESASSAFTKSETTSTKPSTAGISSPPRRSRTRSSSTESAFAAATASLPLPEATASAHSTPPSASSVTAAGGVDGSVSASPGSSPSSSSRKTRGGRSKTGVSRGGRRQLKLDDEASVSARLLPVVEEQEAESGSGERGRTCPLREEPLLEAGIDPRLGTVPPRGSNIFTGYTVLITLAGVKQRSLNDAEEEDEDVPPLNKRYLTEQLRAGGAKVITKFEEADLIRVRNATFRSVNPRSRASTSSSSAPDAGGDSPPLLLLLCDKCCRTSKYIQCLAVGIPIVSHQWVITACDMNQRLAWSDYLLPAGVDAGSSNLVEQSNTVTLVNQGDTVRDTPLLEGDVVFVASSSNEQFAATWMPLLANAAAEVRRPAKSNASLGRILDRKTTVVLADSSIPEAELARARQLDKPVVSSEWFIQSIIMGYKLPCDYHPSFRHDYK